MKEVDVSETNAALVSQSAPAARPSASAERSPQREDRVFPAPVEWLLAPQKLPVVRPHTEPVEGGAVNLAFVGEAQQRIEPFPGPVARTNWLRSSDLYLFVVFLALPVLLGGLYFGVFAANQYVSEFRFNVVDTSAPPSATGGLASVLGAGLTAASSDSYTVTDFLTSPQAVEEVEKKLPLRKIYSSKDADWFYRFNDKAPQEKLVSYWQSMVSAYYDPATGISTAQVRAFSAKDAQDVATALLTSAEKLVNDMQTRQRSDTVKFAQEALDRDNAALAQVRKDMLDLRKDTGYIEPTASGVAENTHLATSLRTSIVTQEAQIDALMAQIGNPEAPNIRALRDNVRALKEQLSRVEAEIKPKGGRAGPLATIAGRFDELNSRQGVATSMIASDLVALQQARAQADAQHIYLSPYVSPTMPRSSTFPNRSMSFGLTVLVAFGLFCFAKLVAMAIRSHAV